MTRLFFLFSFLITSSIVFGQTKPTVNNPGTPSPETSLSVAAAQPTVYLVINDKEINLGKLGVSFIKPDHIEKVEVIKDEKGLAKYNSKNGVILVTVKDDFSKEYVEKLKEEGIDTSGNTKSGGDQ